MSPDEEACICIFLNHYISPNFHYIYTKLLVQYECCSHLLVSTGGSEFDVEGVDAENFAPFGDILGSQHSSVG